MAEGAADEQAHGQPSTSAQVQPPVRRRPSALPRSQGGYSHVRAVPGTEVWTAIVNQLVDRFGRTGFAAITSLIWALPMAAWAGTADLSPIDKTATPWIALSVGIVMLLVWLVLVASLGRIHVTPRQRRFDIGQ